MINTLFGSDAEFYKDAAKELKSFAWEGRVTLGESAIKAVRMLNQLEEALNKVKREQQKILQLNK